MKAPSSSSTTIRFKNSKVTRIGGVALVSLLVWGDVVLLLHAAQVTIAGILGILLISLGIAFCIWPMILMSDIVVDSDGMRRRLLGRNFDGMSWTQVVGVRVIPMWNSVANRRGRSICFDRVPRSKPWYLRRGGIAFMDINMEKPDEVIPVLNKHIAAHSIGIEEVSIEGSQKGSRVPLTQL